MTTRTVLDPSPAPGSAEWQRIMTASKVASVIGLGYESRFTLWHEMAGLIEPDPENDAMAEGTIFEPAIRNCFRRKHPEFRVTDPDGMRVRDDLPGFGVTLDGLVFHADAGANDAPIAVLECKRSQSFWDWGTPGTDEIPVPHRCQVMLQMGVTGINRAHVAAEICGRMAYYVVEFDGVEFLALVDAAQEFMGTLPGQPGEQRPDLDADQSTYQTVRKLHPDIDRDETVDIGADLHAEYAQLKAAVAENQRAERLAKTRILDLAGNARTITAGGLPVLRRQPAAKGAIALVTIQKAA